ncbi:hypothetical protein ACFLX5_04520 [Chloroflexota bacterium]
MDGLTDYSGEFNPKVKYEDFSEEALESLLTEYARLEMALGGWWYDVVKERYGEQEVIECEKEVWEKGVPYTVLRITKALNIQGNDVAACFKTMQMFPGGCQQLFETTWELKNPNHGFCTTDRCPPLEFYERHGEVVKMQNMCRMDIDNAKIIAKFFSPYVKVEPLKLPPRKNEDEVFCIWEFKIEE